MFSIVVLVIERLLLVALFDAGGRRAWRFWAGGLGRDVSQGK
jgi:hypothetical protein